MKTALAATLAMGAALALAACSASADDDAALGRGATPGDNAFTERALQKAIEGNASPEQIEQLEQWVAHGDTPYADLDVALQRTFACFEEAGIPYTYLPPAAGVDYPEVNYRVGDNPNLSEDASLALADVCIERESDYLVTAYQLGPAVTARRERDAAAYVPTAIACLEAKGIVLEDGLTLDQMNQELMDQGLIDAAICTVIPDQ